MAGVIAGILDASYFAAKCTAHPREEGGTVFLIRIGHDDESEEQKSRLVGDAAGPAAGGPGAGTISKYVQ